MKSKLLLLIVTAVTLFSFPKSNFGQITLGKAANFELYTTVGAVTNTGISFITGDVGTNVGSSTGFGNVNGNMHDQDAASAACSTDLLLAYAQLNASTATFFPAPLLGNGQILNAGVYSIAAPSTLSLDLILDGQNNPNAVFIFKIQAAFSVTTGAKVKLINGALACNVYWKVEGLVSVGTGATMRGTILANNAAIAMSAGDTLEGRALSINGAITLNSLMGFTPIGCGSPFLTGPGSPPLGTTACYDLFSSDGPVTNSGVTHVVGDIGTNVGTTTGFVALDVVGAIHGVPDGSTGQCATDLGVLYTYLDTRPIDILLLFPAQFGHNLVLTPHTYRMNGATTFTDTLYLNAENNPNAIFLIQIKGALNTSTFSNIILTNGAQAKNVFWNVDGAVSINDHSIFNGTIIANNGAINLNTGVILNGRALTTTGALATFAITATVPSSASAPGAIVGSSPVCAGQTGVIYSVPAISGATGYIWTLPAGASITAGLNTDSITVSFSGAAVSGTISVQGSGSCGNSASSNFSVTVNHLPGAPGLISGPASVCQGQSGAVYTVPLIAGATGYNWTLPSGSTITTGLNTNTFTVTFGPNAVGDTILVEGTNSCGAGPASAKFIITVNPLPSPAGTITGISTVCPGQTGVGYSVPASANATGYNWTLPSGATIATGLNTNVITVDYSLSAVSGNITVAGTNGCGTGTPSANFPVLVNTPNTPGTITGASAVCPGQTGVVYSVPLIANATGYNWTLSPGATITAGLNTNSITVSFSALAANGNITVQGTNGCGTGSPSANFAVTMNLTPGAAGPITGPPTVCAGSTGANYSVPLITNATGYIWTLPAGVNITSGLNTNTITVSFDTTAISGNITVQGTSACGGGTVSALFILTVNPLPAAAGVISGPSTVCPGQTGVVYSISTVTDAASYIWTLPAGASITAGLNTNSITVSFSLLALNGNISVQGNNACGSGKASPPFPVIVNPTPTTKPVSNQAVCTGSPTTAITFSGTVAGTTFNWTNSNTSTGLGANGIGDIASFNAVDTSTTNSTVSTISVTPDAGGCTGATTTFTITVNPAPNASPVTSQTVCNNTPTAAINFTSGVAGTTFSWTNDSVSIGLAASGSGNIASFNATNAGTVAVISKITVTPSANGCSGTPITFTITVKPSPKAFATSNSPVCPGSTINLFADTVAAATYSWTGPSSYTSGAQNPLIPSASAQSAGTYTLTVTAGGCNSAPAMTTVVLKVCANADLSVVKTASNTRPHVGTNVVFTITASNAGPNDATGVAVNEVLQSGYAYVTSSATAGTYDPNTGVWTIGILKNGASDVLTITVTVLPNGNYVNTVVIYATEPDFVMTNNNASIELIPSDFNIPEGFSPNADGINDEFVIRGIDEFPNNTFVIFNRWGDKVFEASPYQNNWAGKCAKGVTIGGDVLPVGTYFYVLDLKDGTPIYKGTIYLNK